MAAAHKLGDVVKFNFDVPQGPVEKINFDEEGDIIYLISWVDREGNSQSKWFKELDLLRV